MKGFGNEKKSNKKKSINNINKSSKEKIITKAFQLHSQGNITEAAKYYQYCIEKNFNDHRVFCNFGTLLKGLKKFKEAEIST